MRLTRIRFTIRRMLGMIALTAVVLAVGRWGYYRYVDHGFAKTYYVGDLMEVSVRPGGGVITLPNHNAKLAEQAALLKSSITPDVWWFGTRTVNPFPLSASLRVVHTKAGQKQVATWLEQRRTRFYAAQVDRGPEESASRVSPPAAPAVH
jgi:hypothetical protein